MKKYYLITRTLLILTLCGYALSGRGQTQLGENIIGAAAGDQSGHSVSLSADGKIVAIGTPLYDITGKENVGHVRVYEEPLAIISPAFVNVPENKTDFSYTATANKNATFSLASASTDASVTVDDDNGRFTIDPASGQIKFNAVPDFENPLDANTDNVYNLQITASAGTGTAKAGAGAGAGVGAGEQTATHNVTITVTNIADENPPVITSAATASVPENTTGTGTPVATVIYTAAVSDASSKDAVTFTLASSTTNDNAKFTIDGTSGEIKFVSIPDFETPADKDGKNDYQIQITATAGAGTSTAGTGGTAQTVTKDVVIKVTDEPEQGTISLPETLAFADTKVGETVSKVLTISNPSAVALNVTAIEYRAGFTGDWSSGPIAAGAEQVVNLSFKPTEVKSYTGTITVSSDAANTGTDGKNTLSVSGKGILITGIEPQAAFPGLSVFPNPAEDVLNIKLPNQTRPVALQLVDANGQVVYEQEAVTGDELSIDVSGYRSGVYVLVVSSGSKAEKRKVVIN